MIADSPLAEVHPSLGYRKRKFERRRRPPVAIIVHTTGGGPARRLTAPQFTAWRKNVDFPRDTFESAIRIYQSIMIECAHYVVGQEPGQIAQVAPESECAWHVGGKGGGAYSKRFERWRTADTGWWRDEFPELTSPRELAGGELWRPYGHAVGLRVAWNQFWAGGSVNANAVGVEVACPLAQPAGPWSDAAWSNLVALVFDIARRHSIPLDRHYIVSHSAAHPIARSANGKPWDPSARAWSWDRFAEIAELSPEVHA